MLEIYKFCNDKGKLFGVLLIDLSKAFDCLSHKLFIAKIHAHGFHCMSLKLMYNYLKERKKELSKTGISFSSLKDLVFRVRTTFI